MKWLKTSGSHLAAFREEFDKHAVARDRAGSCIEVLPFSLRAIERSTSWSKELGGWLSLVCLVLNYQFCAGIKNKKFMEHPEELNKKQIEMICTHLLPAIGRRVEAKPSCQLVTPWPLS